MKKVMLRGGTMVVAALATTSVLLPQPAVSAEPTYSVISPLGEDTVKMIEMAPRLDTLSNKTVCMVSNNDFKTNITMPAIEKALKDEYPGIKVVPYTEFPTAFSGTRWDPVRAQYQSKGCQAVISGNGG